MEVPMRFLLIFCAAATATLFVGCDPSLNTECDPELVASLDAELENTLRSIEEQEEAEGDEDREREENLDDLYDEREELDRRRAEASANCSEGDGEDCREQCGLRAREGYRLCVEDGGDERECGARARLSIPDCHAACGGSRDDARGEDAREGNEEEREEANRSRCTEGDTRSRGDITATCVDGAWVRE